jgi:hypothetical protein
VGVRARLRRTDDAEAFLEWLPKDARAYSFVQLQELYGQWSDEREARDEPTDNEIYNRPGVEGGIGYSLADDSPGSLGENDWRL